MKKLNLVGRAVNDIKNTFLRKGTNLITDYLSSVLIYKVDLGMIDYSIRPALIKLFPHMNSRANSCTSYDEDIVKFDSLVDSNIGNFVDVTVYKGMTVVIVIGKNDKQGSNRGVISDRAKTESYLCCVRTPENIKLLHELIAKMLDYGIKEQSKSDAKIHLWKTQGRESYMDCIDKKCRTFDDVFVPKYQKDEIINSLDKFIKKREWYHKNNIANHFGILLYGEPSSGKSSIAQAINDYIDGDLYVINGDDVMKLPTILDRNIDRYFNRKLGRYRVILIEDIDCGIVNKRKDGDKYDENLQQQNESSLDKTLKELNNESGLGSLLNCLDGLDAPNDVVFIFTTNHVDKLDKALIRPGRIDLRLEIKLACKETFEEFIKYHFGEDKTLPEDFEIKDNISFASLQTLIMKDASIEEVIAYANKNKNQ